MLRIWNQWVWISSPKLHSAALNVWQVEANQEEDVSFGEVKRAFFFLSVQRKTGKMERRRDWRMTDVGSGGVVIVTHVVSSRGSGVSSDDSWFHSERKRHAAERGGREKEIRPSPLNIYDLGPHRFLATFFAVFRSVEGGRGGVWYLVTHTHSQGSQTSVWVFADTFRYSHMRSVSPRGNEMGGKKKKEMKKKGK